jgi:hypothetical protein
MVGMESIVGEKVAIMHSPVELLLSLLVLDSLEVLIKGAEFQFKREHTCFGCCIEDINGPFQELIVIVRILEGKVHPCSDQYMVSLVLRGHISQTSNVSLIVSVKIFELILE